MSSVAANLIAAYQQRQSARQQAARLLQARRRHVIRFIQGLSPMERQRISRKWWYEKLRYIYSAKDVVAKTWNLPIVNGRRYSAGVAPPSSEYMGLTPNIFASMDGAGTMSGSSEANAAPLLAVMADTGLSDDDIVGMLPDTYIGTPNSERWIPIFGPAVGGSVGAPITYVAKYPAAFNRSNPELWCDFRSNDPGGQLSAVLGVTTGVPYVHILGAYADQTFAPPRPSNGTFLISHDCDGTHLEGWFIDQTLPPDDLDNYDSVFMEASPDVVIKNGFASGGNSGGDFNHNVSCITTYGCENFLIEHCQGENVNQFIYIKGSANSGALLNDGIIRFCRADVGGYGFVDFSIVGAAGVDVYQNLGSDFYRGLTLDDVSPSETGPVRANNNTLVNMHSVDVNIGASLVIESNFNQTGCEFLRNIVAFMSASTAYSIQANAGITSLNSDDNIYYEASGAPEFYNNGSEEDFATWQLNSGVDATSEVSNPGFTSAGTGNFHRGSYADGRGCYITGTEEIGLQEL